MCSRQVFFPLICVENIFSHAMDSVIYSFNVILTNRNYSFQCTPVDFFLLKVVRNFKNIK